MKDAYAKEYIARNSDFDLDSGIKAKAQMARSIGPIGKILECGCNIGRNINILNHLIPRTEKSIAQENSEAFSKVNGSYIFLMLSLVQS